MLVVTRAPDHEVPLLRQPDLEIGRLGLVEALPAAQVQVDPRLVLHALSRAARGRSYSKGTPSRRCGRGPRASVDVRGATAPPCSSAAPADAVILRAGCTLRGMTGSSVARHAALPALVVASLAAPALEADVPLRLWYEKPASVWVEALPVGGGRLGAIVFGGPSARAAPLNDDTLWSGGPRGGETRTRGVAAAGARGGRRRPVRRGGGAGEGDAGPVHPVLPADGRPPRSPSTSPATIAGYRRKLDLDRAVAHDHVPRGGRRPHPGGDREPSRPGDRPARHPPSARARAFTVRLRASCAQSRGGRRRRGPPRPRPQPRRPELPRRARRTGPLRRGAGRRGHALQGSAAPCRRGTVARDRRRGPGGPGADEAVLLVSAGNELQRLRQVARPATAGTGALAARAALRARAKPSGPPRRARRRPRAPVRPRGLDLGGPAGGRPTDERLRPIDHGEEPGALALVFQSAATCSSRARRPGGQPANLQGIWNEEVRPPWSAN